MDYYSMLYLHGAQADAYLTGHGAITPVVVAPLIQRMVEAAPNKDGVREHGGLRLRDGDTAARHGQYVLIWSVQEWDLWLLRVEG